MDRQDRNTQGSERGNKVCGNKVCGSKVCGSKVCGNTLCRNRVVGLVLLGMLACAPLAARAEDGNMALPAGRAPQSAGAGLRTQGGEVLYDQKAHVSVSLAFQPDGAIALSVIGGGLQFTKRVYADGRFEMDLQHRVDRVAVSVGRGYVRVARPRAAVAFDPSQAEEESQQNTRVLLADSTAVHQFRAMVANLDESTLDSAAGLGLLLADAEIGVLGGDVAAIARLAPVVGGREAGAAHSSSQRAANGRAASGGDALPGESCYVSYRNEVVAAWNDYASCNESFWWVNPLRLACATEWVLRAESAWFSFLSCSAFPRGY